MIIMNQSHCRMILTQSKANAGKFAGATESLTKSPILGYVGDANSGSEQVVTSPAASLQLVLLVEVSKQ